MYIRYDGAIESKSNGHKKIRCSRSAFSHTEKHTEYKSGRFYSLLMGCEFKPNQYAFLLDFEYMMTS